MFTLMHVCHICAWCHWIKKRASDALGTRVTAGCDAWKWMWLLCKNRNFSQQLSQISRPRFFQFLMLYVMLHWLYSSVFFYSVEIWIWKLERNLAKMDSYLFIIKIWYYSFQFTPFTYWKDQGFYDQTNLASTSRLATHYLFHLGLSAKKNVHNNTCCVNFLRWFYMWCPKCLT